MNNNKDKQPDYQSLSNKPVACTYCANTVQGRITEQYNPHTKQSEKLIRWNCGRCGNIVRIGRPQ